MATTDGPGWSKGRRTPMRGSKRIKNWLPVRPGYFFEGTRWQAVSWPDQEHHGAKSWIEVLCLDCGKVYRRQLYTIIRGQSHRCCHCAGAIQAARLNKSQREGKITSLVRAADTDELPARG